MTSEMPTILLRTPIAAMRKIKRLAKADGMQAGTWLRQLVLRALAELK